jgi:hypothetical protein
MIVGSKSALIVCRLFHQKSNNPPYSVTFNDIVDSRYEPIIVNWMIRNENAIL